MIKIKKPIKIGDKNPDLPYIREYLAAVGDLKDAKNLNNEFFDEELEEAIKNFQIRHGLNPDGIIGKKTIEEINYPLTERLKDIAINLEKIRWLEESLSPNRLEVNIPSFTLDMYTDNKLLFTMKVIVGKGGIEDFRPTFVYCGKVKKVVFNPYWHVPQKIAIKDILPKVRKNPNFLIKNNFKVFLDGKEVNPLSVNWYKIGEKSIKFVQLPGEKNALGKVKIEFENPFDIYLHDTPYKELFEKDKRDLSSGCIRLENAHLVVKTLLLKDGYEELFIENLFSENRTFYIDIKSTFIVYILYFTTLVKDDKVYFFRDIYRYDKILKEKLFSR